MTREFSDELLSAYLDGELSPAEREAVDAQLAASEEDRELLAELQALRSDLAALPRVTADAGFADRVVRAAVSAKADRDAALSPAHASRASARRRYVYAALGAAAVAACFVIAVQLRQPPATIAENPDNGNTGTNVADPLLPAGPLVAALAGSMPGEGEAVVLRLRLSDGQSVQAALDKALAAAGISQLPSSDVGTGAAELGAAYQRQLQQQLGSLDATSTVADALFVEAPLEKLQTAIGELAKSAEQSVALANEARIAFSGPSGLDVLPTGESGGSPATERQPGEPFAQRLHPGSLRLKPWQAAHGQSAAPPPAASIDGKQLLRVLILIERVE